MHILIIGGSDAGISAALRAREINPDSEVTVLIMDGYPNFSICGLPFFISGEVTDWKNLAHRSIDHLLEAGIRMMLHHKAMRIDIQNQRVLAVDKSGNESSFPYDKLVIATGAVSARPPLPGSDLPGVFFMRFMSDGFAISGHLKTHPSKYAAIIGSGYIGMEMADALHRQGLSVTLIEMASSVMPALDKEFGELLKEMLCSKGIRVLTSVRITEIKKKDARLMIHASDKHITESDFILVAAGARPNAELATAAGIQTGPTGAIKVNQKMETSAPNIYAAGDCAETYHRLINTYKYMPLGTTAHKQGRISGENACGGNAIFKGVVGTQSVKNFDLVAARTGFRDMEARTNGFDPLTIQMEVPDHKAYYPGAAPIHIRITGDRNSKQLLGAQIIGHYGSEISKRIDVIASALYSGLTVFDLIDYDLSYTPPLSSPWDPIQMAAFKWLNQV
jgi:NADPH-dependent 2,4-dienoyl-CoA reductase/sulfur reductase-like enzyme